MLIGTHNQHPGTRGEVGQYSPGIFIEPWLYWASQIWEGKAQLQVSHWLMVEWVMAAYLVAGERWRVSSAVNLASKIPVKFLTCSAQLKEKRMLTCLGAFLSFQQLWCPVIHIAEPCHQNRWFTVITQWQDLYLQSYSGMLCSTTPYQLQWKAPGSSTMITTSSRWKIKIDGLIQNQSMVFLWTEHVGRAWADGKHPFYLCCESCSLIDFPGFWSLFFFVKFASLLFLSPIVLHFHFISSLYAYKYILFYCLTPMCLPLGSFVYFGLIVKLGVLFVQGFERIGHSRPLSTSLSPLFHLRW